MIENSSHRRTGERILGEISSRTGRLVRFTLSAGMHNIDLILTLTGGLVAALALGFLTHRLGLSPIVGYLLAGIVVGPETPGFVANHHLAEQMAEIGVILLMFGVGLHFHLKELLAVRRVAIPGAIGQSLLATVLAMIITHAMGWSWTAGVVFGLAISVASTVVLVRVLADNRELHTPTGHIAVGWLVVEDLFTVVALVLLPALFGSGAGGWAQLPGVLGMAALKIGALVALIFVVGGRVVPWLMERVAATRSRELFTLTVLVLALGIAVGSAKVFGVSMALGAFLAGMVVGRSEFSQRAAAEAMPMRDAFAVLFFVSVGMLLDPQALLEQPGLVAATLAVILIGKPLAAFVIVVLLRYPLRAALAVSVALAQIGEFSFILAALAKDLKILDPAATNILVASSIVSITLNPILFRLVNPTERWVMATPALRRLLVRAPESVDAPGRPVVDAEHRSVVIGYGPVGRTVTRLLRENGIEPCVIEMNLETVRDLRNQGVDAIYGDAAMRDILTAAKIEHSDSLILSASSVQGGQEVVRLARELNPEIHVLTRSNYVREQAELRSAGADAVFSGEGEVALAMTETLLRELGATPEQVDVERERVRKELQTTAAKGVH